MQQKNLTKPVHGQSVRHGLRTASTAACWVVDSKPLEPRKYSLAMAHRGCSSTCWDAAVFGK